MDPSLSTANTIWNLCWVIGPMIMGLFILFVAGTILYAIYEFARKPWVRWRRRRSDLVR